MAIFVVLYVGELEYTTLTTEQLLLYPGNNFRNDYYCITIGSYVIRIIYVDNNNVKSMLFLSVCWSGLLSPSLANYRDLLDFILIVVEVLWALYIARRFACRVCALMMLQQQQQQHSNQSMMMTSPRWILIVTQLARVSRHVYRV